MNLKEDKKLIPDNINRDHILKAIEEIKRNGVPEERQSTRFSLVINKICYPPKYVISIANKFANGTILDSSTFSGGNETNTFLRKLNFEIIEQKTEPAPRVWLEKTYYKDRPHKQNGELALGKALISPQKDKRGADIYRNMRLIKENDLVLHLIDNRAIVGISKVKEDASKNPSYEYNREGENVKEPGYLVRLKEYISFNVPVAISELLSSKNKPLLDYILENAQNMFYNTRLDLRQGAYLTLIPEKLMTLINRLYKEKNGEKLPYWDALKELLPIALLGLTDENYIAAVEEGISSNGQIASTWSYNINKEKIELLQANMPFYLYCYITGGGKLIKYRLRVKEFSHSDEEIKNPFNGSVSLEDFEANNWFIFDKVENIQPLRSIESFRNFDDKTPVSSMLPSMMKNPRSEFTYVIDETEVLEKTMPNLNNHLFEKIKGVLELKKQIILYGPPGTGKTFVARGFSEWLFKKAYQELNETQQVNFITFHTSYSYEEFVEGITANTDNGSDNVQYIRKWGIFKKICTLALASAMNISIDPQKASWEDQWNTVYSQYARLDKEEKDNLWKNAPNQILIIDEINRGDISKIFGELITLLEADKRLNQESEIKVSLPYSNDFFCVPPNLYIIATMNTADRSIALIDVALRRRFGFVELSPKLQDLQTTYLIENQAELKQTGVYEALQKSIDVLIKINTNIIQALGRDKQIGQSFFFKVHTPGDLVMVWEHELLPLIEEYFYCDYTKITQILEIKNDNPHLNEAVGIKGFQDFSDLTKFLETIGEQEIDNA